MTAWELRHWRMRMGWTQQRLADEMGYTRRYIVKLEQQNGELSKRVERMVSMIDKLHGNRECG